jgi:tripartite-type tricarboxylate transporter receptor subunit TctC
MECPQQQNKWEARMKIRAAILLAVAVSVATPIHAQTWPARTITLVVPFAAGGGTDAIGRVVAEKLAAHLGQPVVVENKAGAASAIGTAYVAKAAPDGYTLLMTTNSAMVILPLTQPAGSLNYDRADFSMIGLTGILPNLLIVSPKIPANSVSELIAYAKAAGATVVCIKRQRHDHASDRRIVQGAHRHRRGARSLPDRRAIRP